MHLIDQTGKFEEPQTEDFFPWTYPLQYLQTRLSTNGVKIANVECRDNLCNQVRVSWYSINLFKVNVPKYNAKQWTGFRMMGAFILKVHYYKGYYWSGN